MTRPYRTALLTALLALGCGRSDKGATRTLSIEAHYGDHCAPQGAAQVDLRALGDFDPSAETAEVLPSDAKDTRLVFPADTRAVTAHATTGRSELHGRGVVGPDGNIDVLLWPTDGDCTLFEPSTEGGYPDVESGQALGVSKDGRTLLVVGGGRTTRSSTAALAIDLGTGTASELEPDDAPVVRRAHATVTATETAMVVAGGEDPVAASGSRAQDTAELFDLKTHRFDGSRIELGTPRTRHGAVELESGDVLLVAGAGPDGRPLRTLEVVDPVARRFRINGLADLHTARIDPTVLKLTDDRILVAGGTDEQGEPIAALEWLAPDASRVVNRLDRLPTPPTRGRAFVAMPGGSALAVGGCEQTTSASDHCHPSSRVLWIRRDGTPENLEPLDEPAPSPVLIPASGARPWLVAGDLAFFRFDPWQARFGEPAIAPRRSFLPGPAALVAPDPGLMVGLGLTDSGRVGVSGFRHDTRCQYSNYVAPLILGGLDGLSPDRAPGDAIDFHPDRGVVGIDSPDATLIITDTTYADVTVEIAVRAGEPPILANDTGPLAGDDSCPWPKAPSGSYIARFVRHEANAMLFIASRKQQCEVPPGRLSLGLRTRGGPVEIERLTVLRTATPP